jgi:hypothetical protein
VAYRFKVAIIKYSSDMFGNLKQPHNTKLYIHVDHFEEVSL